MYGFRELTEATCKTDYFSCRKLSRFGVDAAKQRKNIGKEQTHGGVSIFLGQVVDIQGFHLDLSRPSCGL